MLRRYFERLAVRDTAEGRAIVPELRDGVVDEVMADLAKVNRAALRLLTTAPDGLPSTWVIARIAARAT